MKNFKYLSFLLIFLIISCGPGIIYKQFNDMLDLKKGMKYSHFKEIYEEEINIELDVTVDRKKYFISTFYVSSDVYQYTTTSTDSKGNTRTTVHTVKSPTNFILIFDNNKLMYYGFWYELKNSSDKLLQDIAANLTFTNKN